MQSKEAIHTTHPTDREAVIVAMTKIGACVTEDAYQSVYAHDWDDTDHESGLLFRFNKDGQLVSLHARALPDYDQSWDVIDAEFRATEPISKQLQ